MDEERGYSLSIDETPLAELGVISGFLCGRAYTREEALEATEESANLLRQADRILDEYKNQYN